MPICCCCGEVESSFITCNNNHTTCADCVENGTKSAIGNIAYLKCPDSSGCNVIIDESQIGKVVIDDIIKTYSNNIAYLNTKDIENLHKCNNCDYAIIIECEITKFECVVCDKVYCRCKKDLHPGVLCNAEIYAEAEALTSQYIIRCTCGISIIRHDACNHLTCSQCRTEWCWYCKRLYKDCWVDQPRTCPTHEDPPIQDVDISAANIAERLKPVDIAEQARLEREERQRLANEALARIEQERLARLERERLERERLERERLERERLELERLELIRLEQERLELIRLEQERLERKRIRNERIEWDRLKRERLKQELLEQKCLEQKRLEKELIREDKLYNIKIHQLELEIKREDLQILKQTSKSKNINKKTNNIPCKWVEACTLGYIHIVEEFLNKSNFNPVMGLHYAVTNNQIIIVDRLIVDSRINPEYPDNTYIKYAIKHNYVEIVKSLLTVKKVRETLDYLKAIKISHLLGHELITLYLLELKLNNENYTSKICKNTFL